MTSAEYVRVVFIHTDKHENQNLCLFDTEKYIGSADHVLGFQALDLALLVCVSVCVKSICCMKRNNISSF